MATIKLLWLWHGVGFGAVRWNVKSFLCQTQLQLRLSWRFDNDFNEVSLDIQYHFLGHLVQKTVICNLLSVI